MKRIIVNRAYILFLLTVRSQGRSESGCPRAVNGRPLVRLTVSFFEILFFFLFSFFLSFFSAEKNHHMIYAKGVTIVLLKQIELLEK
jgi:hypothetical protein